MPTPEQDGRRLDADVYAIVHDVERGRTFASAATRSILARMAGEERPAASRLQRLLDRVEGVTAYVLGTLRYPVQSGVRHGEHVEVHHGRAFSSVNQLVALEREAKELRASLALPENEDDRTLRRLLWLRHGCPITALYGDDGEMQCGRCRIDFKRAGPEEIAETFRRAGLAQLAAVQQESASPAGVDTGEAGNPTEEGA